MQGPSPVCATGRTRDGVGAGLREWLMGVCWFVWLIGHGSEYLNLGRCLATLATSSGNWHNVNGGMSSPWRLGWKLGPLTCWVLPPLQKSACPFSLPRARHARQIAWHGELAITSAAVTAALSYAVTTPRRHGIVTASQHKLDRPIAERIHYWTMVCYPISPD